MDAATPASAESAAQVPARPGPGRSAFRYADEHGLELPLLVLALRTSDPERYRFAPGREWIALAHQTAGHACHQHFLLATVLSPSDRTKVAMFELEKKYLWSDLGCYGTTLAEINAYRDFVRERFGEGVDIQRNYTDLEEGIYPLEMQVETLRGLVSDDLPDELDELVTWQSDMQRLCGIIGRWHVYVLGKNCD